MSRRGRRGKTDERLCAVEECGKRAKRGSMHCDLHAKSAVGQVARRELKDLLRELGQLAEVPDPKLRRRADIRFMRKLESGRYPVLFSNELKELEEERRRNAELGVELGGLRLGLYRALLEIGDPGEMAKVIVQVSEESRRFVGHCEGTALPDGPRQTLRPGLELGNSRPRFESVVGVLLPVAHRVSLLGCRALNIQCQQTFEDDLVRYLIRRPSVGRPDGAVEASVEWWGQVTVLEGCSRSHWAAMVLLAGSCR